MGFKFTCTHIKHGDICMKIKVGDYEISVAFESGFEDREPRSPSDIIIFDKNDNNVNNDFFGPDNEHYPVDDFDDILNVVELVKKRSCCVICQGEIDKREVFDTFSDIFFQADSRGVDSLTEHQQMVYEFRVCSEECYEKLE